MKNTLDFATALFELRDRYRLQPPHTDIESRAVSRLAAEIIECVNREPQRFPAVLETALDDLSRRIDRVSIAVTGLGWLGSGVNAVQHEMISLIRHARREIALCTYSITSGARELLAELGSAVAQGVDTTLVINGFQNQPPEVQAHLSEIANASNGRLRLLDFHSASPQDQLHAKVLVVDRAAALVGSANLSFHGMVSGHELSVVVRGPTAEIIAGRIDMLVSRTRAVVIPLRPT